MPIHEYNCRACGHAFEALTRASTTPECPRCHGQELEKKLSVFATPASQSSQPARQPDMGAMPCGACGNPAGPGACAWQGEAS